MDNRGLLYLILFVCSTVAVYVLWSVLLYIIVLAGLLFALYHLYLKDKIKDRFDD
jgi:hypothetical protein